MFADDMHFTDMRTRQLICNESSMRTWQQSPWLHDNKLTLNVTKSKFMIIGSRKKLSQFNDIALVANNDQLENVTKIKYLGVTINQYLTWHARDHIEQLQSKIAKRLSVLRHLLPSLFLNVQVSYGVTKTTKF